MGDIAIVRTCPSLPPPQIQIYPTTPGGPPGVHPGKPGTPGTPPGTPGTPPGTPGTPPSGGCPPNQVRDVRTGECGQCARPGIQINGKCCSVATIAANAACSNSSCPSGQTAIGPSNFCCNSSQVYTGAGGVPACCSGQVVNGQCQTPTTPPITSNCPSGYVAFGSACCLAGQMTSTGICCPSGQVPSGPNKSQCQTLIYVPVKPPRQCCASGSIPTANGKCCSTANVTSNGVCCAGPVNLADRTHCPVPICATGYARMPDGSCCNSRYVSRDGKSCNTGVRPCGPGEFRDLSGACVPMPPATGCAPGEVLNPAGECVSVPPAGCPEGKVLSRRGECVSVPRTVGCPAGQLLSRGGKCVPSAPPPRTRGHKEHRGGVVPPPRAGPRRPGVTAAPPPHPGFRGPFGGRRGFFRR